MTAECALLILLANISRWIKYKLQGGLYLHFFISAVCHFSFYFPSYPTSSQSYDLPGQRGSQFKTKTEHSHKIWYCASWFLWRNLFQKIWLRLCQLLYLPKPSTIPWIFSLFYLAKNLKQSLSSSFIKLLLNNFVLSNQTGYFLLTAYI